MAMIPTGALLPDPILFAAVNQSDKEGITPEQWLDRNITYNPNAAAEAEEFWNKRRTWPRKPSAFDEWLKSVPDVPPMPGDELES